MTVLASSAAALDYAVCQYGTSRMQFRGPHREVSGDYIVALGGAETFGCYVEDPFPTLLEQRLGMPCINLGTPHAGPDAFLADTDIIDLCRGAGLTVLQVPGAHALQNKFFTLHKRRNDRLIQQSPLLRAAFPEADFSQYHFVRHMLHDLQQLSPRRFQLIKAELQRVWITRMNQLSAKIAGPIVLVWIGDRTPDHDSDSVMEGDPPFVTGDMLRQLRGKIVATVEVLDRSDTEAEALQGKVFPDHEIEAALRVPGPTAHQRAADLLAEAINGRNLCLMRAPVHNLRAAQ